jgi:hypothetical protein
MKRNNTKNEFLCLQGNALNIYHIGDRKRAGVNNENEMYFCVSVSKMVTRTRHNITLYMHCLCGFITEEYVPRKVRAEYLNIVQVNSRFFADSSGRSHVGIADSNSAWGTDACPL